MRKLLNAMALGTLTIALFLGCINTVSADLVLEGEKSVDICHKVTNLSEFSGYKILVSPVGTPGTIDAWYFEADDKCLERIYKLAESPKIYAIPTSEFNEAELNDVSGILDHMIPSDVQLRMNEKYSVPKSDPTEGIEYQYMIQRIDAEKLWIYMAKKLVHYEDGTFDVETFEAPVIPDSQQSDIDTKDVNEDDIANDENGVKTDGDRTFVPIYKTTAGVVVIAVIVLGVVGMVALNLIIAMRKKGKK